MSNPPNIVITFFNNFISKLAEELGPCAVDCMERLSSSTFDTYKTRSDSEHWETLIPRIKRLFLLYQAKELGMIEEALQDPEIDVEELNEKAAWFIHMIDCFDQGDSFIIAKLKYQEEKR